MKLRLVLVTVLCLSLASTSFAAETPAVAAAQTAPVVKLTPLPANTALPPFLTATRYAFVPAGNWQVDQPLVLENREDDYIVGSGRLDFGAKLNFGPQAKLLLRNCKRITLCNLWLSGSPQEAGAPLIEVTGTTTCEVRFLNCMVGVGAGPDGVQGCCLAMRAPGKLLLQQVHVFGGNPGLLVDHAKADVTVLGGNYQSEVVHIRQLAGRLQAYCIGFQVASGGADVELNKASAQPHVIAACRTEGPKLLVRTAETAEKMNVVVKGCGVPLAGPDPFLKYDAAGTLFALGNNARGGIDALGCTGTVVSLGNSFEVGPLDRGPYELGPQATCYAAGDLWVPHRPNEEFSVPWGSLINAEAVQKMGRPLQGKLYLLQGGEQAPQVPTVPTPLWVPLPVVSNLPELLVDVKQHGAKGDGTTDDTEALQKCLDEHLNQSLYFPEGQYVVSKPLFLDHRNGGWLAGAGREKTVIVNKSGGSAVYTNGCGYACFSDLGFEAAADGKDPAFDMSWDRAKPTPPWALGGALQANAFYRCRFSGGDVGFSIGREGFMGSEHLMVDCVFENSGQGLAVRNYNALTNNAVGCLFRNNNIHMAQESGSFNAIECRFEGAKQQDVRARNSALDCFYFANCQSDAKKPAFASPGQTGAIINLLWDGCKFAAGTGDLVSYGAGGSVMFLNSDLGQGTLTGWSGISVSSFVALHCQGTAEKPLNMGGRSVAFVFP